MSIITHAEVQVYI